MRRAAAGPVELDALLAEPEPEYDWLVPGLLERGDRLILTGPEGGGKSTLLRQMAVQLSSGIHPFTLERLGPVRTLLVDLENSRAQVRRKLRPLRLAAGDAYPGDGAVIQVEPQGTDLYGHPADADWLAAMVEQAKAELLLIGPHYKLAAGDPTSEEVANRVRGVLDRLRDSYGLALVLEAHTPYAGNGNRERVKRPYGASLWSRWPEFGYHLARDGSLTSWRGDRDEREWPAALKRGGSWPWSPITNPLDVVWARIRERVDQTGHTASIRMLVAELELNHSAVQRALALHREEWDDLKRALGDA